MVSFEITSSIRDVKEYGRKNFRCDVCRKQFKVIKPALTPYGETIIEVYHITSKNETVNMIGYNYRSFDACSQLCVNMYILQNL